MNVMAKSVSAVLLSFLLLSVQSFAKDNVQELRSVHGDVVTVRYKVVAKDGQHTIVFDKPEKQLSRDHRRSYDEPMNVKVVFFENVGSHGSDVFKYVDGCSEKAITVNINAMRYEGGVNGVVEIDKDNSVNLTLLKQEATLSVPVFLAYYKKRNSYEVFAQCGTLEIPLSQVQKGDVTASADSSNSCKQIQNVVVGTGDDDILTEKDQAMQLANKIRKQVSGCTSLTELESVEPLVNELIKRQAIMQIVPLEVSNAIDIYNKKSEELRQQLDDITELKNEEEERRAAEQQARSHLSYVKERLGNVENLSDEDIATLKSDANMLRRQSYDVDNSQLAEEMRTTADRCDELYNKMEQAKKRRNIWMIIGGILLAIAMMLGGQALQHFRNLKNQRGLEEMQNKMMQRAQNEAQRRAQSVLRSKISRAQNQARRKANDAIRNSVDKGVKTVTKGKKGGISI